MKSGIIRTVDLLYDIKTNWSGQDGGKWQRRGSLWITCEWDIYTFEENNYRLMLSGR
jgi:hypothetical protein